MLYKEIPDRHQALFLTAKDEYDIDRCESISTEHFHALVFNDLTTVHEAGVYLKRNGEFLNVTVTWPSVKEYQWDSITIYGLGFHISERRWLVDRWGWHPAPMCLDLLHRTVPKEKIWDLVQQRKEEIAPQIYQTPDADLFDSLTSLIV